MIKNIIACSLLSLSSLAFAEQVIDLNQQISAFPDALFVANASLINYAKPPEYPGNAAKEHICGSILIGVLVDVDGKVIDAKIIRSTNSEILDAAAMRSVKKNVYKKISLEQVPVQYQTGFSYKFSPRNPGECKST